MLLVQDAKLLLLDEPVAGMTAEEREQTGQLLHRIGRERTMVVVEHDMDFVRCFADVVTVMHAGTVLAKGTVHEVQSQRRGAARLPRPHGGRSRVMAEPHAGAARCDRGLRADPVVHDVSLEVPVAGAAAVMGHNGAGKTTLLRAVVGLLPRARRDGPARRRGRHEARPAPAGTARPRLRAAGPAVLRADDDPGEPAAGRGRDRVGARRGARHLPRTARPARRVAPGCCRADSASSSRSPARC